jgi:O-antigen ligase
MPVSEKLQATPAVEGVVTPAPPAGDGPGVDQPHRAQLRWSFGFVGMLAYLVVEYMRVSAQYQFLLPFQVGKVVVAVCFLGWLIAPRRQPGDRSPIRAIDVTLVLLLFGAFFSVLFAEHKDLAWGGFGDLLRWAVIYFLIGRIVTSSWRSRIFVFVLLLLNVKLAQAGIRYYFGSLAYWGNEMIAVKEGARAGSVGFFSNSADFGVAMCVVWPLTTMLLFMKPLRLLWRVLLLAGSGVFLVAILDCGSRGALVGAVCVVLAGMMASKRKLAVALMALLLIPGVIFVLPGASKERIQSALHPRSDPTASSRLVFWKAGLMMFRDHPLLGVGIKNFPLTRLERYGALGDTEKAWVPHSLYIEVLSELGLAGIIPALALFVLFFRLNAKTRKLLLAQGSEKRGSFEYCLALGLDLALVGYLTSGAFVAVFYYPHLWVLMGLSAGLYTACCRLQPQSSSQEFGLAQQTGQLQSVGT